MNPSEDITGWGDRIEHAIGTIDGCCVSQVFVYQRVSSTQDAAFRHRSASGGVLAVASEQTAGRGRLGRRWDDGLAGTLPMSVAIETNLSDVQLAARAGLAALDACTDRLPNTNVLIKWPNDVVVRADAGDRKLAGVLIERREGFSIIGVGVNVRSNEPSDGYEPVSFEDLGVGADRCDLAIGIMGGLSAWLRATDDEVRRRWSSSDAMVGTDRAFESDRQTVRGRVIALDPLASITLRTEVGDRTLDASRARTTD
jgi:biotin-[acetyl-CoA-carboxylase] ligase BirA-like protein